MANRFKKGGTEDTLNVYKGCDQEFMGIGNVHVVRESFRKLRDLCLGDADEQFYSTLAASRWLDHISQILKAAARIVDLVHRRAFSVVIHCTKESREEAEREKEGMVEVWMPSLWLSKQAAAGVMVVEPPLPHAALQVEKTTRRSKLWGRV